jgi:hypothetical protein
LFLDCESPSAECSRSTAAALILGLRQSRQGTRVKSIDDTLHCDSDRRVRGVALLERVQSRFSYRIAG